MTPKEKATELFEKMLSMDKVDSYSFISNNVAKISALLICDECVESIKQLIHQYTNEDGKRYADIYMSMSLSVSYWQEVKQEIINL